MTEIYHVLNRGVDKRKIFLDNQDHFRFIHDLFEFNDQECVNTTFYKFNKSNDIANRKIKNERQVRKFLVNIHAFCLMPNHYHLLLSSKIENGISRFMQKLNGGYVQYFNGKYERSGTLFEGKYKKILVENEAHFIHLPYYIHLNPLDLLDKSWRDRELNNYKDAIKFLEKYRWSSHLDYMGKKNFPSVTQRELLSDCFGGYEKYTKDIYEWLKNIKVDNLDDKIKLE